MIRTEAISFDYSHIAHPESVAAPCSKRGPSFVDRRATPLGETIGSSSKREQYRRLEAGWK